jgi:AcrR family transcriptional regulator
VCVRFGSAGALHALDHRRDAHATADAKCREAVALLAPLELIDQRAEDHRTGCAERVAHRDRAAVDLDLLEINEAFAAVVLRFVREMVQEIVSEKSALMIFTPEPIVPIDAEWSEPKQARAHETRRRLLDAAVDELLDRGYVGLTAAGVANRAGVSRGAQQNYFPHKTSLVAAAVRHLAARQTDELREQLSGVPRGRERLRAGLDVLFDQYSGRLFAAVVELSLASRGDTELQRLIVAEERDISQKMHEAATVIFGEELPSTREIASRWATVLSAIRGLALLKLLGHSLATVDRQWISTRGQLLELLIQPEPPSRH